MTAIRRAGPLLGALLLGGWAAYRIQEGKDVTSSTAAARPAIDLSAPAKVETATFALG